MEKKEAHMTTSLNCASHAAKKVWSRETFSVIMTQDRSCNTTHIIYGFTGCLMVVPVVLQLLRTASCTSPIVNNTVEDSLVGPSGALLHWQVA